MYANMAPGGPGGSMGTVTQLKTYEVSLKLLADPTAKDDVKLKAAQDLSENFEIISSSVEYPNFLDLAIKVFLKVLREGKPHFIAEHNIHQVRKLILEMIYRIPTDKYLKPYSEQILSVTFKLLETENEENVHLCLRIIIELHRYYRRVYNPEIEYFLLFVKNIYQSLPDHVNKIFEPRPPLQVEQLSDLNLETLLNEVYTKTPIHCQKLPDGTITPKVQYNLIPKGMLSLKVLQELPTIVVVMYELYKDQVLQDTYIPIIIKTITLQPLKQHRTSPSFNKDVFVDFMGAQIKTLSFLAYIIRVYQDVFGKHSQQMLEGILNMLRLCPAKVTHLRKELLMAARHIWATDLRLMFVPHMETLFNEEVLLGQGWTTYESLRPLAYSSLADLVHHVRQQLPMSNLVKAVHIFSKNVHDDTLPTSIQTISCKLLLNLVDCIRLQSEKDPAQAQTGQDLLLRMLEVFVMKFKTIAKLHLPILIAKSKQNEIKTTSGVPYMVTPAGGAVTIKKEEGSSGPVSSLASEPVQPKPEEKEPSKCRFGFPPLQPINYNVTDCCSLVKTLVCGVKAITWRFKTLKLQLFKPKETEVFIRFVKWALQALDVYTLSLKPAAALGMTMPNQRPLPQQTVRTKEEKDALEHFSGVFSVMSAEMFREIFSTTIDFIVERMAKNFALQTIGNSFLSHTETSPLFGTVLVEYLLGKMEEMGNGNMERSDLYLKLFKLVFETVPLHAAANERMPPSANEQMLRPHLHRIVNRSMELAMTAKEPYNYFVLLRTLFRSIGGGKHDLLYQEFLPLLPNLLQGLNSLQSGLHKQHMKDLFVELCLTVPVRLSSLLTHLQMLMDPLVSALNGSPSLIAQGLRTLELCIDNLRPDFLYDHIQPVQADLMQALWKCLRSPNEQVAFVAFRILGKLGGGNRKMMIEPQKLDFQSDCSPEPAVVLVFPEYDSITLPISKVVECALNNLKSNNAAIQFYKQRSWYVVRDYLLAAVKLDVLHESPSSLFGNQVHGESRTEPIRISQSQQYLCNNKIARQTHVNALVGMFLASLLNDIAEEVQPVFEMIVRHFTLVALSHQAVPGPFYDTLKQSSGSMDPLVVVMVDAVANVMGHEDKELCKPGRQALALMLETAETVLGSKDTACRLPLFEYVAVKMYSLCYDRAWYTKRGGCLAITFLYESMSIRWIYQHLFVFVKAQLFVIMDLTGEVSSGVIDQAKANLEALIKLCAPINCSGDKELQAIQEKALNDVLLELTRQVTSPTELIREQAMYLLRVCAEVQGTSIVKIMEPHKKVLEDMVPPKTHNLRHQGAKALIGILEGNTFCTSLTPRLFVIDMNSDAPKDFFDEVRILCDASDEMLLKMPCYKNIGSLVPLRKAAMRTLAACYYIPQCSNQIFNIFYQCLEKDNEELQEAAFQSMKTFVTGAQIDINAVHEIMRPLLASLKDYRNINLTGARRLSYLVQLFPSLFNEVLCDQLKHLQELLESMIKMQKGVSKNDETEQIVATIIGIFHQIPAAGPRFIEPLSQLVLQTERNLLIGASSPFRLPLMKFHSRYPQETITLLLSDNNVKDDLWSKYLEFLIKHEEGRQFREVLQSQHYVERLIAMAHAPDILTSTLTAEEKVELRFQSIRIVSLLVKYDDQWLSSQQQLAQAFNQIWCNDLYQQRHRNIDSVDYVHWKEPKLLVKILLNYFSHHPSNIDLLFQLLRAFCDRFLPSFQFLKDFLETIIAQSYTVEWKRMAFFRFVELFPTTFISQRLKAKILQFIIIPCFANCFDKGENDKLIGGPPSPNVESPENIISEFINKVVDPANSHGCGDSVRILVLQLACLLVEQCVAHIHDPKSSKPQGSKLKRLLTYAWLVSNNCVDPATRYHGHLLLSHIIAKLAIDSDSYPRIVLQAFQSLLKAHALEVRPIVRQALEILTPAMPDRLKDGYKMLTHWTKKVIVEEGHSTQQLFHILQLVVRHYAVYYPVRHNLLRHMITALQRFGFSVSSSIEHKKLGCELAEIIIRWEHQRIKDENQLAQLLAEEASSTDATSDPNLKRPSTSDESEPPRKKGSAAALLLKHNPDAMKPLEKTHADILINTLMNLACSVNETSNNPTGMMSPGEILSRRCCNLVRTALKPDIWPNYSIDFRLQWMDKIFCSVDLPNPNLGNVCVALELFTLALSLMKREQVLSQCRLLQKGINTCISSSNTRVIRLSHLLLTRLMSFYPTEPPTANVSSKHAELECIYSSVGRVIFDGLSNYEKNTEANSSCLFGAIMMLKAACSSNASYVDRLITPFIRVIQRMTREHLERKTETHAATSDLLILSLDLVKNRVGIMQTETKKAFIGSVLVSLIENTTDSKVMKCICKMVEEWMKNSKPTNPGALNTGPSLREKSILLGKLMQHVEKTFPDLNTQFLETINYIYREEAFKTTELIPKLEPAFLAGLRCTQPQIRAKFFEIFDQSIRRRLPERLMYIVSSQNWEPMGQHYWIKQCIELVLVTADEDQKLQLSREIPSLPGVNSAMSQFNFNAAANDDSKTVLQRLMWDSELRLSKMAESAKLIDFLYNVIQLCHLDTPLAEKVWLDLFPRLWSLFSERQRTTLASEMLPFLVSGCHVSQKDMHPSSLSTIFEAISKCDPPLQVKPALMSYLGKTHNLWHMVSLGLEKLINEQATSAVQNKVRRELLECYDFEPVDNAAPQQAAVEYLVELYSLLKEEDMWCALWQKHARYKETSIALAYEQQGYFEQAQKAYELAVGKCRQDYLSTPAPISLFPEQQLWESQWIRCSKELNHWDHLLEYSRTKGNLNPFLTLETAWRVPDWGVMKETIAQIESSCPKELLWKVHLYRGYLTIYPCILESTEFRQIIEKYNHLASTLCLREWRRLPRIVSHIHLPLLQAAQQILELQEAGKIHLVSLSDRDNSLLEMKNTVKTWKNRLPIISDDLSHWSDIFTWRQHYYQYIIEHVDTSHEQGANSNLIVLHASAQVIIHFGKIARKHNLTGVCLNSLARIYTIPSVPLSNCFHKIRQEVKCHLQMALISGTSELQEGLAVLRSSKTSVFPKEMSSEFLALEGLLLAKLGHISEADNTLSAAVQRQDTLVKAWGLWGDFVESQFVKSSPVDINLGVSAITCFLHTCRHPNEPKSRKYLAKVLWLLTYDDDKFLLTKAVVEYMTGVPAIKWLPWIPQVLSSLLWNEGKFALKILSQVGHTFVQAVYLPIRTIFSTVKIKQQLERNRNAELTALASGQLNPGGRSDHPMQDATASRESIKASESLKHCTSLMRTLMDAHPTAVLSLEGLIDQFVWLREIWSEEVLRLLKQGLAKCYAIAFENRGAVSEATITTHTEQFLEILMSTFGIGIENPNSSGSSSASSAASESLAKRAEVTVRDPDFIIMKKQFTEDFKFSVPGAKNLQNVIQKLKKWIRKLEAKTKLLPKSFLLEEKCRFISSFSLQTVEIELPGEFLLPKHPYYFVKISRFMPRVELVQKHNTAARRLFIRGHNGKIYPYLVVNSGLSDTRREERVLQLLRMLNHYLGKQKETSRRFLHITVPRVVAWTPHMRLVEDNPASVSLLDVYKNGCAALNIEHDAPVTKYYERLAAVQARRLQASHQILKDILKEVQTTMIPRTLLKDWALRTYPSHTDFWTFRKMFTLQLSLTCFCEYVLHLTRLNPDMLYIHQDSGLVNVLYFMFDVEDTKGELNANRPVPFRLTPNIQELLTETGINGPLTASMIATAKCLVYPNYEVPSILRAIMRDEMIFMLNRRQEFELDLPTDVKGAPIVAVVNDAINSINSRLNSLSHFEGTESEVSTLVVAAKSPDNLCRMDPAWHPWF